ncbi:hypothetical protein [Mycobacterium paragordonae]|uniref:ESX-1 secretion-associated protein n=1 Tax=Mycobacterium paragordonae TaxID=1389713 RepID=A0A4R5WT98_9MYCO|nr:hypothetical protein [Mycobacterium paragordonae]PJE23932.1 MAG: hypothetical protein CK431_08720 [Mycobacterium sp.]MDP7733574.1 hypothetical protein [Mycobacterium paragordonae]TDK96171.1 hypothetical protein EUA02_13785 [Mycobacterium paragordonae]TDK97700.1 hypothetical protein EI067_11745 [Mycobacterium paragordonae]TDL08043.1 hypothetical protein EUA05_11825 [Mycobacterium paragordonae]
MSVDEPPSLGSLNDSTQQLRQWGQNVPEDILKLDRAAMSQWFAAAGRLADALHEQAASAGNLKINEGVVGSFQSARVTARNLNETGDAIRQRISEYATFATALRDFSNAAYNALLDTDR